MTAQFGLSLVGFGPANSGLLIAAAQTGHLQEFLDAGVQVIERRRTRLGGRLSDYQIPANSVGSVFLECLEQPGSDVLLAGLDRTPEAAALRAFARDYPPLSLAGKFMELIAERLISLIESHKRGSVQLGAHVSGLHLTTATDTVIETKAGDSSKTGAVVLGCGGESVVPSVVSSFCSVVGARHAVGEHLLGDPKVRNVKHVLIVGGSHTAWGLAAALRKNAPEVRITILQRRSARIFYSDVQTALAAGCTFTADDVCPLSGRVYRMAGLRGEAGELAHRVLRDKVEGVETITRDENLESSLSRLASQGYDLVVSCLGFSPALPSVFIDGDPVRKDAMSRILEAGGGAKHGLFTYSLGAGPRPSLKTGGEPSFRGRVDGVWNYQNDAGFELASEIADWLSFRQIRRSACVSSD